MNKNRLKRNSKVFLVNKKIRKIKEVKTRIKNGQWFSYPRCFGSIPLIIFYPTKNPESNYPD